MERKPIRRKSQEDGCRDRFAGYDEPIDRPALTDRSRGCRKCAGDPVWDLIVREIMAFSVPNCFLDLALRQCCGNDDAMGVPKPVIAGTGRLFCRCFDVVDSGCCIEGSIEAANFYRVQASIACSTL